jgi:hypothetical protein
MRATAPRIVAETTKNPDRQLIRAKSSKQSARANAVSGSLTSSTDISGIFDRHSSTRSMTEDHFSSDGTRARELSRAGLTLEALF